MPNQKPDTKCRVCRLDIYYNESMGTYVDEDDGMPMCYPPGQLRGNLAHSPEEGECQTPE